MSAALANDGTNASNATDATAAVERRRLGGAGGGTASDEEGRAQHCSGELEPHEACLGPAAVTAKQRKMVAHLADLTATPAPELERMTHDQARAWLGERWQEYMDPER